MSPVYLDTETTGLSPTTSRVVEIALVAAGGGTLLHTLIDPGIKIPADATAIHGIRDEHVAGAPRLIELLPAIVALVRGHDLVIYNKAYDLQFLPFVEDAAADVLCCMQRAQDAMKLSRWPKLTAAAQWAGYQWQGKAHSALADTLAARHVWLQMDALVGREQA